MAEFSNHKRNFFLKFQAYLMVMNNLSLKSKKLVFFRTNELSLVVVWICRKKESGAYK